MERYRALVVEDEYWIRKDIATLIEESFGGAITVLESGNGEEALKMMEEEEISFVRTDINMPFMDGIALISYITKSCPDIPVLVLSGYCDFPLVRKALTGGALDYLLKPVKEAELKAAVEKAKKAIEQNRQKARAADRRRRQELIYEDYARDLVLSTHICGKGQRTFLPLKSNLEEYLGELSFPAYIAVIQHNFREDINEGGKSVWERRYDRKKRLAERMEIGKIRGLENAYRQGEYILFSAGGKDVLEKSCLNLENSREKGEAFRICLGRRVEKAEEVSEGYRDCILKLMSNAEYGKEYQYMTVEDPDRKKDFAHWISQELDGELVSAFHQNSRPVLEFLLLEKLGIGHVDEGGWLLWELEQVFGRLRSLIQSYYINKKDRYEMWEIDSLFDSVERAVFAADTEEIVELSRQMAGMLTQEDEGETEAGAQGESGILKVIEYVGKHYTENLTLSLLSEKFYLAPAYLSRSFKKQTGQNLIAYMTEKRLKKAVDYIKIKEMSLTEIAFLVGYSDYTYFNKVFRRYMGVSPTQFRDNL